MVSIIVPVLNEEKAIPTLISHVCSLNPEGELIIVDGGSTDLTVNVCREYQQVKTITSGKGRAMQMNKGAQYAKGEVILFLHADTTLPEKGIEAIEAAMLMDGTIGGSFFMKFDKARFPFGLYSAFTRINNAYFTYGDQGIFIRKSVFQKIGGYTPIPILEDFEIQKRLRKQGKFIKLPLAVTTSTRRFDNNGVYKQQFLNIILLCAYEMGVSPVIVKKFYSDLSF